MVCLSSSSIAHTGTSGNVMSPKCRHPAEVSSVFDSAYIFNGNWSLAVLGSSGQYYHRLEQSLQRKRHNFDLVHF